ncbi:DMT family transporter [Trabulsiella odontotermitis]|uniref:DMT family transporter n=1 Tax=Trabulsiella odontotermitis TaxID=379893 RepID=UPI0006BA4316|nr:EamA family transporter [Trabulsiella odontotermitis]
MADKSALLAMASGICWGTSGLVMRYLSAYGFDAVEIGALRLLVAAGVMSAIALRRPAGMRISLRQLPWLAAMGAGCLFLFSLCYVLSVQEVSLSLTAVLIYTSPAIVMLLSVVIFNEPLTRHKLLALALTFCGCSLAAGLFPATLHYSWRGIGFALLAALLYALYAVLAKIQTQRGDALTVTAWSLVFGAAAAVMAVNIPHGLGILRAGPGALLWVAVIGILNTAVPYLLYTRAVSLGEASKAAMMASVEPVVATLLGMAVFHETPGVWACLGILLVISGLLVMNRPGVGQKRVSSVAGCIRADQRKE